MECRLPRKLVQFPQNQNTLQPMVTTVPDLSDHPLGKLIFLDNLKLQH